MKVKRLFFESVKEGIRKIKDEYGPDAIIIDIKESGDPARNGYEVLIALEEDSMPRRAEVGDVMKRIDEISTFVRTLSEKVVSIESDTMRYRIDAYPPLLKEFYERMIENDFPGKLAYAIINEVFQETGKFAEDSGKAGFFLKRVLAKKIQIESLNDSDEPVMLLGPSGAGKTDTAKKLAKRFSEEKRPVSIISFDPMRKDRYYEYMVFSENTGIPFHFTAKEEDLSFLLERDSRKKIIDVTGHPVVQQQAVERLKSVKKVLLFPAWTRAEKVTSYAGKFKNDNVSGIIFTKLDEEEKLGHLCGLLMDMEKPIHCFTTGAGIDDMVMPDNDVIYQILLEENVWKNGERRP